MRALHSHFLRVLRSTHGKHRRFSPLLDRGKPSSRGRGFWWREELATVSTLISSTAAIIQKTHNNNMCLLLSHHDNPNGPHHRLWCSFPAEAACPGMHLSFDACPTAAIACAPLTAQILAIDEEACRTRARDYEHPFQSRWRSLPTRGTIERSLSDVAPRSCRPGQGPPLPSVGKSCSLTGQHRIIASSNVIFRGTVLAGARGPHWNLEIPSPSHPIVRMHSTHRIHDNRRPKSASGNQLESEAWLHHGHDRTKQIIHGRILVDEM